MFVVLDTVLKFCVLNLFVVSALNQMFLCICYLQCLLLFLNCSIITNIQGTVSITPMENSKTFVNGNLISESTVLQHVSRLERSSNQLELGRLAAERLVAICAIPFAFGSK